MTHEITTTNLADFGHREWMIARDLLNAMIEQGLPDEFEFEGTTLMLNRNSGYVFLTNAEHQVAMLNGEKLELFRTCPECGKEGFAEEVEWNEEEGLCGECAPSDDEDEEEGE